MKSTWHLATALLVMVAAPAAHGVPYTFIKVADEDTASPTGPNFSSFNSFVSISDGTAAFSANWSNLTKRGVFTGNGGPITTIAQIDSSTSGSVSVLREVEIRDGLTAFVFDNPLDDTALFAGSGGPLTTIAESEDMAPAGTFDFFSMPSTFDGTTAFVANYDNNTRSGVFTGNGGPLTTIIQSGAPAPSGAFNQFISVAFDDGRIAFLASFDDSAERGVFLKDAATLSTIAKTGDAAPSGVFSNFGSRVAISGSTVAFLGMYNTDESGIFLGDGTQVEAIAQSGSAAPVGVFDAFGYPVMNADTVAFLADYNDHNSSGIFTIKGGTMTNVLSLGDPLFGLTLTSFKPLDSQALDIDEQGNIAFLYRLSDGREGVAIATPVPEPTSAVLMAVVCMGLTLSMRSRRCGMDGISVRC
jgi:hypothetical protein